MDPVPVVIDPGSLNLLVIVKALGFDLERIVYKSAQLSKCSEESKSQRRLYDPYLDAIGDFWKWTSGHMQAGEQ